MKIPHWLSLALSFALIAMILIAYAATHVPAPKVVTVLPVAGAALPNPVTNFPSFTHMLTIGTTQLEVAFSDTDAERDLGLSDTTPLMPNTGMLFLFPAPTIQSFWMKDMNYPLDIIWIGSDKKVTDITPSLAPSTYPAAFGPADPIQYVLEVPAGFAQKNNIIIGTQVEF